jgi:hypothetical protein
VSELRSTLDEFRVESVSELPDARIEEDFAELHRIGELVEIERLRRLGEIDRRGLFRRDGFLSTASWLSSRFRIAWGVAREHVRMARAIDRMPVLRSTVRTGDVPISAVRILAAAHEAEPGAFARAEERLVEAARVHPLAGLQRVVAVWRQVVEREHELDGADVVRDRRRLHASATLAGSVRVDGDLDPETGETLLTALRAVLDAEARSGAADDRTPPQRRADALGEICRRFLDHGDRPAVAGERPHVTMTVAADALPADADTRAEVLRSHDATMPAFAAVGELDHAGPVPKELARQLACDASVMRVVLSGGSEPLDVGRRTPVVPAGLRRAVTVRDRHCRFPGCDRPHSWCDAHHVLHWADGGPTALSNLVLLCRRHHGMVHRVGGFRLELLDDRPVFRRPDGSILEDDRAPP